MSELQQDVSRRKRRFGEEFKRDAVRLVVEEGYTFQAAAAAVGVSDQSLRAWHAKYAPPPAPCGVRRNDGANYQPRLHDFRHTFAVTRLVTWYREGKNVQRLLPHLATYLGHVRINETSRYLSVTKELLSEASRCFELYALPEVKID